MSIKIYLCLIIVFLSGSCKSISVNNKERKITVLGLATEDKEGAMVLNDKYGPYFIDGLDEWDENYSGKIIEVTGILFLETHTQESNGEHRVQERLGTIRIIKKAKWKLSK